MTRQKAVLLLDPRRRREQRAYLAERVNILQQTGDQLWAAVTERQVARFTDRGIRVQLRDHADLLELPAIVFDPLEGEARPPEQLSAPVEGDAAYHLVQFVAPPTQAWLGAVARLGGEYVQAVPVHAAAFRLPGDAPGRVAALRFVRWVGPHRPTYALHHSLAGRAEPFTRRTLRDLRVSDEHLPTGDEGNVEVRAFEGADREAFRDAINVTGAEIRHPTDDGLVLDVDSTSLSAVLRLSATFVIEPYIAPQPAVAHGRVIAGLGRSSGVRGLPASVDLRGEGEIVGVIDTGLDTGEVTDLHSDVGDRVLEIHHRTSPGDPVPDVPKHGTHVTGIIASHGSGGHDPDGVGAGEHVLGIAPSSHIVFQGPLQGGAVRSFLHAHRAGARIHNNSWRTLGRDRDEGHPLPWANTYIEDGVAHAIDRFCAFSPDDLVVFVAGNEEQDVSGNLFGRPDGSLDEDTLPPQATSKNVLVVGATESLRSGGGYPHSYRTFFSEPPRFVHSAWDELAGGPLGSYSISEDVDQVALFSNRGTVTKPVDTGRTRPDLVAPGTNILSLRPQSSSPDQSWEDPDHSADLYYFAAVGTSFAAPHVSGAAALARQYYRHHHGQLRRPATLDSTPPWAHELRFVDRPAVCPHADGVLATWVSPAGSEQRTSIVAARLSADGLEQVDPAPRRLVDGVGAQPAPTLARHGDAVLLLHHDEDAGLQLRRYRRDLSADVAFGADGVRSVTDGTTQDPARPHALAVVGDHVALAWSEEDDAQLRFRRFDAADGDALDDEPIRLGEAVGTSPQDFLTHNGDRYAAAWIAGAEHDRLCVRLVANDGDPVGSEPVVLAEGDGALRDAHLLWDEREQRFAVVWCRMGDGAAELRLRFLDSAGQPTADAQRVLSVPSGAAARRPLLAAHPAGGFVLLWEDAARRDRFEPCLTILDTSGTPITGMARDPSDPSSRRLLRLSVGTEEGDAGGFAAVVDAAGATTTVTQSHDHREGGRRRTEVLRVTPEGAFQQRADRRTPLHRGGRYVAHTLAAFEPRHSSPPGAVAAAWTGGGYAHLRVDALPGLLALTRTTADGLPELSYGDDGTRTIAVGVVASRPALHWTPGRLVMVAAGGLGWDVVVRAYDDDGGPLPKVQGRRFPGLAHEAVSPQVASLSQVSICAEDDDDDDEVGVPALVVAYGTGHGERSTIHYTALDCEGLEELVEPIDLVTLGPGSEGLGTARHGWLRTDDGRGHLIAAWHEHGEERTRVMINRFSAEGEPQHGTPIVLTDADGDARSAVIALRPVGGMHQASQQREYAVAWEQHPPEDAPVEIWFSRLDPDGTVMDHDEDHPSAPSPRDVRVIHPGAVGWPGDTDALAPQLACTFTWEPVAAPGVAEQTTWGQWRPGFGLAWIGRAHGGGLRRLHFTALDENGRRLELPLPPPHGQEGAQDAAPIGTLSDPTGDVLDFQLLWNGRTFHLVWTEDHGGAVHHRQAALTRHGSHIVHDQPSSALLRATLINGATNLRDTKLPNLLDGYGWGRLNLRQALAPAPPATVHVRDGDAVAAGRRVRYRFALPTGTRLLRVTLAWTDPAGAELQRVLHLRVVAPGGAEKGEEYHGNDWELDDCKQQHVSRVIDSQAEPRQNIHNTEQVVLADPRPGVYDVEVLGDNIRTSSEAQHPAAPFALVFVGSGPEQRFTAPPALDGGLPVIGGADQVTFPLTSFPIVEDADDGVDYSASPDPDRDVDLPVVPLIEVGDRLDERLSTHFRAWDLAAPPVDDRLERVRYARLDPRLVEALQRIRDHVDAPVMVSSGYRHPALNEHLGGPEHSQHLLGRAADIWSLSSDVDALALAEAALRVLGLDIGLALAADRIHVDVRGSRANWTWGRAEMDDEEFEAWVDDRWAEIRADREEAVTYQKMVLPIIDEPEDDIDYDDPVDHGELDPVPLVEVGDRLDEHLSRSFRVRDLAAPRLIDHDEKVRYARLDPQLVEALQLIRDRLHAPVVVTSGYRYAVLDDREDPTGASDRQHLTGRAADIASPRLSPIQLARVVLDAIGCDIGIGLLRNAVHLDLRGHRATWTRPGASMDAEAFGEWVAQTCGD